MYKCRKIKFSQSSILFSEILENVQHPSNIISCGKMVNSFTDFNYIWCLQLVTQQVF